MDEPATRILAARRAASRGAETTSRHAEMEWSGHQRSHREFICRLVSRSRHAYLGLIPRRWPAWGVSPHLSSIQLAWLGGLGRRRDRRYGRTFDRSLYVGTRFGISHQR